MPWGSLGGFEAYRSTLRWVDPLFQAASPVGVAVEGLWWSVPRFRFLSVLFGADFERVAQTIKVTVKRTPKKTMDGSSEMTAPSSVFDVFMVSSLGSRGVWLTET